MTYYDSVFPFFTLDCRDETLHLVYLPIASITFLFDIFCMNRIIIDPDICNGQPVIQGTRITAQTVLEFIAAGDSVDDILDEYPSLTRQDVLECVRFSFDNESR